MTLTLYSLLERGYFPKELPPQFTTKGYADRLAGPNAPPKPAAAPPRSSLCSDHSVARGGALRRHLRIPNPVHYYALAEHVVKHWEMLNAASALSPYSLTNPVLGGDRALNMANSLRSRVVHRARLRADGRYLVRADITRFYSSIYTHSLPWAVLGKAEAKRRFLARTLRNAWSDKLDRLLRKLNAEQTAGTPTGPDISLLLAEVLLGSVDVQVNHAHPSVEGIRYIDDYEFVTQTREEAEGVLSSLQGALREVELELNGAKTSIGALPLGMTEPWVSTLRRQAIDSSRATAQHEDLSEYFGIVFDVVKQHGEDHVLRYALGRLQRTIVHEENWEFFEHLLQQCAGADPACLQQVGAEIEYYRQCGLELNSKWYTLLNRIVQRELPLGNANEAGWAMCLLLQFELPMSMETAKVVERTDDSVAALMGGVLARAGLTRWEDLAALGRYMEPHYLNEPQWLLCYEASIWQWFGGNRGVLSNDPWFQHLAQGSASDPIVTFLQPDARVAPSIKPGSDDSDDDEDDDEDARY